MDVRSKLAKLPLAAKVVGAVLVLVALAGAAWLAYQWFGVGGAVGVGVGGLLSVFGLRPRGESDELADAAIRLAESASERAERDAESARADAIKRATEALRGREQGAHERAEEDTARLSDRELLDRFTSPGRRASDRRGTKP